MLALANHIQFHKLSMHTSRSLAIPNRIKGKGEPNEREEIYNIYFFSLACKLKTCAIHQHTLFGCSVNSYTKEVHFVPFFCFLQPWAPRDAVRLVRSLPIKSSGKRWARDVFHVDTFCQRAQNAQCFMIGVNVWWVYLAPQNIPRAISVLTLGNKVILYYCIVYCLWLQPQPSLFSGHKYAEKNTFLMQSKSLSWQVAEFKLDKCRTVLKNWC